MVRKKATRRPKRRKLKRVVVDVNMLLTGYDRDPKVKALNPKDNPYPFVIERRKGDIVLLDGNHRASGIKKWAKKNKATVQLEVYDGTGVSYKEVARVLRKHQKGT